MAVGFWEDLGISCTSLVPSFDLLYDTAAILVVNVAVRGPWGLQMIQQVSSKEMSSK